ncbi:hypothetical protein AXF42_Ash004136 [Apostasia shenzhenica]|uniref:Transposase n=1 Tax=Apostasia shenzhenica TaxID=1088818 RepID=A0A2I0A229_9ASPA|nr:hypothetical protein AXF42_Ash004136 [Apostasia shenzhenica]
MKERKNNVLSHIRYLWSNWRADLNRKYLKGKTPHVALAKVPDKLTKIEWEWLVKCYFSDPKYKEKLVAAILAEPHASHIEIIERCFGPHVHSHITCYGSSVKKMQQDPEKKILLEENLQLKKEIEKIKADIAAFKDLDIGV